MPRARKTPVTYTLDVKYLQRIIESVRHDIRITPAEKQIAIEGLSNASAILNYAQSRRLPEFPE